MYDSYIVRIGLSIYIIFAGLALFLLWRNSAAPDALKNVGILVATILPVLIGVYPYLNKDTKETNFTFILLYDSQTKSITSGNITPYNSNPLADMFTNLSQDPKCLEAETYSEFMGPKGLNIIEKGIIQALLMKFSHHWDLQTKKFDGPIGISESWSLNSKLKATPIELTKIQQIFSHNPLIKTPGILVAISGKMYIPPDCNIKNKSGDQLRSIIFDSSHFNLKITFHASSAMVAQRGIWGTLIADPANINRYYVIEYKIDSKFSINRTETYSPEMDSYRRWYENINDILSKFDWSVLDQKNERRLNREAISKTLGINS